MSYQLYDSKYNMARNWIKQVKDDKTWEEIDFGLGKNEDDLHTFLNNASTFLGNLSNDEWHALVANIRDIEAESSHFDDMGPVYCFDDKVDNDLTVVNSPSSAWTFYSKKLEKNNFSTDAINSIRNTTERILKRLKIETEPQNPLMGLVIGNVQSGKTANMAALMAMAADNGFNFFLILSGTIDNLREQTNNRLIDDLNSPGCGLVWYSLNQLGSRNSTKLSELRFDSTSPSRYFYVCLKNKTRLNNFIRWLKKDIASRQLVKLLIIDDEADQAGINTQDLDNKTRSAINQGIVNIVYNKDEKNKDFDYHCKCVNYIGYTATPYANVLNESPDREYSLYPRNFVVGLEQSKEYFGPQQIFGDSVFSGMPIINEISQTEIDSLKKIHDGESIAIPDGLKEAILWFYCCFACFKIWNIHKPVSMLIHTSQDTIHHDYLQKVVSNYLQNVSLKEFLFDCKNIYEKQIKLLNMDNFRNYYSTYTGPLDNDYPNVNDLINTIKEIKELNVQRILMEEDGSLSYSKGVHLCIDNCKYNSNHDVHFRLAYPKKEDNIDYTTGFIVIGGATLSRGLTIEGLVSTYFLRTVKQADTLMQMGRWFGYRRHYELLPRIWLSDKTINKFKYLSFLDFELRREIELLDYGNQSPAKTGVKIKNTPKNVLMTVTSDNKKQDSIFVDFDHTGTTTHTTSFYSDDSSINTNLNAFADFINKIKDLNYKCINSKKVWENVDYKVVFEFLECLKYPVLSNDMPDFYYLKTWYKENYEGNKISNFNVIVSGSDNSPERVFSNVSFNLVNRSKKNVSLNDDLLRLGVIRDTSDLYIDMDISNLSNEERKEIEKGKSKNYRYLRNKAGLGKVSQLIIYLIDHNSKPQKSSTRVDLNSKDDLVGIYLSIAGGEKDQNYNTSIRVRIEDFHEEDELDV